MNFMIEWKVRPGALRDAIERFLNEGDPLPPTVKSVARYHRSDLEGGVHIVEANDAAAVTRYAAAWADVLELQTTAVVEDAEAIPALASVKGVRLKAKGAGGS